MINTDSFQYHKWKSTSDKKRRCQVCGMTQTLENCGRFMGRQWWPISGECKPKKGASQ